MPSPIGPLDDEQIIADLWRDRRRSMVGTAQQTLIWEHDRFVAPATYQLSYLPYGINVVALNGLAQAEGVDFDVDYTSGVLTFGSAPTSDDEVFVSYVTTGELVAATGPADNGDAPVPAGFTGVSFFQGSGGVGYKLWTWQDGTPTQQADVPTPSGPFSGAMRLSKSGSTYTGSVGGTTICTWTDTGGVASWGAVVGVFLGPANLPTSYDGFTAGGFTDNFTRANGDVGNGWDTGTPAPQIASNALAPPGTSPVSAAWMLRDIGTAPSYVQITITGAGTNPSDTNLDYFHVVCGTGSFV